MKTGMHWQRIAERLAEAGWSWSHRERVDRKSEIVHVAEAHNLDEVKHLAVATAVGPAFFALERSIKAGEKLL